MQLREQCRVDQSPATYCTGCIGRSLNICRPLDDRQLPDLVALGGRRHWRKRDILFRAGDPILNFFKITKGAVAVSRFLDDGRRQIVAIRIAGDCVGYLHTDGRYSFEGHALTDVEACTFNRRRFDVLANQYPTLAAATTKALVNALTQSAQATVAIGQLRSTERVAYFLAEIHTLYESRFGDMDSIYLEMSRGEIADYLGLTIETVSRSLSKLKKRSLITFAESNEIQIIDKEALREVGKFGR